MSLADVGRPEEKILDKYEGKQGILIQVLLDIQGEFNWIPPEVMQRISERFGIPKSEIFRTASFYKALSLIPRGRHLVRVCLGTACHVRGGSRIVDRVGGILGIQEGETTEDDRFTMERVNCLGCCALGPVMMVDQDYHGNVSPAKVEEILERYD
ncbi:NAD(P)H-dependent oxidoreductase subunit E [Chloroflexota bacterium]